MEEANIRQVIQTAVSSAGGFYYHPADIPYKGAEERARPDVFTLSSRPTVVIEVKKVFVRKEGETIKGLFNFSVIKNNQRTFLDSMTAIDVPVFLGIGSILKTPGKNDRMGSIVLIPWEEYFTWENLLSNSVSAEWSSILEKFEQHKIDVKNAMLIEGTAAYKAIKTENVKAFEWLELSRRF